MIFAACIALRGHGTHINILWFSSWSARFALGCRVCLMVVGRGSWVVGTRRGSWVWVWVKVVGLGND